MNITMTIVADTPSELFSTIKGAAALLREDCPTAVPDLPASPAPVAAVPTPTAPPVPTYTAPAAPAVAPPIAITPAAPVAPAPTAVPTAAAPAYTLDQLNRAGADLITAHPEAMPQLNALMSELGVQTLSQLRTEMYGTVALRLRELGARI
ncbi:MAG: hypothetical protein RSD32_08205 [Oscillospiraceae bacterium]